MAQKIGSTVGLITSGGATGALLLFCLLKSRAKSKSFFETSKQIFQFLKKEPLFLLAGLQRF